MDEILKALATHVLYRENLHRKIWGRGLYTREVLEAAGRVATGNLWTRGRPGSGLLP